jgi:hypothetical protein
MNTGKCPYCQKAIIQIEVEDVDVTVLHQPRYKGFAYLCPACRAVLSVQLNPLALETDTVNRVAQSLQKQPGKLLARIVDALSRHKP